jgi:hypothetical protein
MKMSLTTLFGLFGAIAGAVSQVPGIPTDVRLIMVCITAACVAGLGYHASDQQPRPPLSPLTCSCALIVAIMMVCAGCKVGGLGIQVASPAFGSVGVSLDGGVIGHGHVPTNAPIPVTVPLR